MFALCPLPQLMATIKETVDNKLSVAKLSHGLIKKLILEYFSEAK